MLAVQKNLDRVGRLGWGGFINILDVNYRRSRTRPNRINRELPQLSSSFKLTFRVRQTLIISISTGFSDAPYAFTKHLHSQYMDACTVDAALKQCPV